MLLARYQIRPSLLCDNELDCDDVLDLLCSFHSFNGDHLVYRFYIRNHHVAPCHAGDSLVLDKANDRWVDIIDVDLLTLVDCLLVDCVSDLLLDFVDFRVFPREVDLDLKDWL